MSLDSTMSLITLLLVGSGALVSVVVWINMRFASINTSIRDQELQCVERDADTRELVHKEFQSKMDAERQFAAFEKRMDRKDQELYTRFDKLEQKLDEAMLASRS